MVVKMTFKEELEEAKVILKENAHLKKNEFQLLYNSVMDPLQEKYPVEWAEFWDAKKKMPFTDPGTIKYALKKILHI